MTPTCRFTMDSIRSPDLDHDPDRKPQQHSVPPEKADGGHADQSGGRRYRQADANAFPRLLWADVRHESVPAEHPSPKYAPLSYDQVRIRTSATHHAPSCPCRNRINMPGRSPTYKIPVTLAIHPRGRPPAWPEADTSVPSPNRAHTITSVHACCGCRSNAGRTARNMAMSAGNTGTGRNWPARSMRSSSYADTRATAPIIPAKTGPPRRLTRRTIGIPTTAVATLTIRLERPPAVRAPLAELAELATARRVSLDGGVEVVLGEVGPEGWRRIVLTVRGLPQQEI